MRWHGWRVRWNFETKSGNFIGKKWSKWLSKRWFGCWRWQWGGLDDLQHLQHFFCNILQHTFLQHFATFATFATFGRFATFSKQSQSVSQRISNTRCVGRKKHGISMKIFTGRKKCTRFGDGFPVALFRCLWFVQENQARILVFSHLAEEWFVRHSVAESVRPWTWPRLYDYWTSG